MFFRIGPNRCCDYRELKVTCTTDISFMENIHRKTFLIEVCIDIWLVRTIENTSVRSVYWYLFSENHKNTTKCVWSVYWYFFSNNHWKYMLWSEYWYLFSKKHFREIDGPQSVIGSEQSVPVIKCLSHCQH